MRKKDFDRIAMVVRLNRLYVTSEQGDRLADDMARVLAMDNPRFDTDRFIAATELGKYPGV